MNSTDFSWHDTEYGNSRFIPGTLPELESMDFLQERATLQRDKAGLKLLVELANQVLSNLDLRDVVRAAMMNVRTAIPSDGACVFLWDAAAQELRLYAFDFTPGAETLQERATVPIEGTIAGAVLLTGRTWTGNPEEAGFTNTHPMVLTAGFKTGCMLPIRGRHEVLGTLGL